jgi:membrane protease subunit (stomatin/prohibitin family)
MSLVGADTFNWEDRYKGENVMFRIPKNIRWNDNVVVREDEYAIFFRDGKVMHVFDRPGRYAMTTLNVPILAKLAKALTGIEQLGEIYYLQKRELRGKFGTPEPLVFRDTDFGMVRLRMFGQFAYKILDPTLFMSQFVGTKGWSTSQEVIDWMRDQIVMSLNDALGELKRDKGMGAADMPAYLEEIEQVLLVKVDDDVTRYGVKIMKLSGLNINLPEEVQKAVDMRGAMGVLGTDYMRYQAGKAMVEAAEGGGAGGGAGDTAAAGMGLGVGAGLGMMMPQMMQQGQAQAQQVQTPIQTTKCPKCNADVAANSKFCPSCGNKIGGEDKVPCPKCTVEVPSKSKFCPNCGNEMGGPACPKCKARIQPGTKFCSNCGEKIEG